MAFACGRHRALIYEQGGLVPVGELTPLQAVRWNRKRDAISDAEITIGTTQCCELLGDLRTVRHELHIERDGERVWQGVITRLEYEFDQVRVYAEDLLWVAKRTVIKQGYSQAYPNLGLVLDRMDWLLRVQTYTPDGDRWRMVPHLHKLVSPGGPQTTRSVAAYETFVWDDFDSYAEDAGTDYTVVGRDIYYWDINYRWKIIAPLLEEHLAQFPRLVEYGNQLATRGYVSNYKGYAGTASAPAAVLDIYGGVDWLVTGLEDEDDTPPNATELAAWSATAGRNINGRYPSPVAIVIPANSTLLPGAPWEMEDLVPGAWFQVSTSRLCRSFTEWQRISEVHVEETAPDGEHIRFSTVTAPSSIVDPVL